MEQLKQLGQLHESGVLTDAEFDAAKQKILGLWTLKRWAFWATVVMMVIDLLSSAFEFTEPITGVWKIWGGAIIPVVVLIDFLVVSKVRTTFQV